MDKLVQAYKGLLTLHRVKGVEVTSASLKTKIKANVPGLEFSHPRKYKPELVCAKSIKDNAVGKAAAIQHDRAVDVQKVFDAAKIVRREIFKNHDNLWNFDGSLHPDTNGNYVPSILYDLLRWILEGPQTELTPSEERASTLDRTAVNIAQSIMYEMKSHRQLKHTTHSSFRHDSKHENARVLSVGLKVHAYTRSKHLIDSVSRGCH